MKATKKIIFSLTAVGLTAVGFLTMEIAWLGLAEVSAIASVLGRSK